jgi:hypothetical protein
MTPSKAVRQIRFFNTTVGEFVEAVYDAAMEEYMDELMARRITMQLLLRKLRIQRKLPVDIKPKSKPNKP